MNANAPGSTTHAYPQPGEVLEAKYQIEKMLGEGGMGAVAKATHLLRHAPVALKFMNPMYLAVPGAVERFRNEGIAASQLDSDHVVQIYDVGTLPSGAPYLVMEYLQGCDLADLLAREGRPGLPIDRTVHFMLQILRGLQVAHHKGIVHRDMKPSNCFVVEKDGEPDFVKLLDFGISKVTKEGSASLTRTNSALGTPLYMSPEQAKSPRDVDARSDIYSSGVILYELLTGKTPFFSESGEFTEILYKLFTSEPPPVKSVRPDLPDGLAAAVHRALARDTSARFADVAAMAEALAPYAGPHSATLIARIRNFGLPPGARPGMTGTGHRISVRPPAQSAFPPGALEATPAEVLAATMGAPDTSVSVPKPAPLPAVRTDLGASRDTAGGVAKKKTSAVAWIAIGGVVVVGVAGTLGAMAMKGGTATRATASAVVDPSAVAPPQSAAPVPVVIPTVPTVAPAPSAPPSASASASPSAAPSPPKPPAKPPATIRRNPDGKPCGPGRNPCID